MGDYTNSDQVAALCKRVTFTSSSLVTIDEVNDRIAQHEAELGVALAMKGFPPPVSEPAWLVTWLSKIVAEGVAASVLKSWFQDPSGPNSEASWAVWERRYQEALKWLRDPRVELNAESVQAAGGGVASWGDYYDPTATPTDRQLNTAPVFTTRMEW